MFQQITTEKLKFTYSLLLTSKVTAVPHLLLQKKFLNTQLYEHRKPSLFDPPVWQKEKYALKRNISPNTATILL